MGEACRVTDDPIHYMPINICQSTYAYGTLYIVVCVTIFVEVDQIAA